jgi:hypothetical protein
MMYNYTNKIWEVINSSIGKVHKMSRNCFPGNKSLNVSISELRYPLLTAVMSELITDRRKQK